MVTLISNSYSRAQCYKVATARESGRIAAGRIDAWDQVLGVLGEREGTADASAKVGKSSFTAADVDRLVGDRNAARARKDFKESDRIRDLLKADGIAIKDTPQGTRWHADA